MRFVSMIACMLCFAAPVSAEFRLAFKGWGDIPSCTSGRPNVVGNPEFSLTGVPSGTTTIQFKIKDLDVPNYNHGGSKKLKINTDGQVAAGTFKYKSPCPPNGAHTYQWTATARKGGKILARATAARKYPE
ncbi:YbhB/YbcL family Raf kinase inhibitor-like protein [Shimia marina]|uniref:Phospholipid-binding protein n=1 Tax=Shimia marina TaxID=321267 RepID=A0A0P1EKP7_9RHOB|nr:hypothetical protein [Shimia marina]CUH51057.1 hypothetical protein SHM7688_00490 [Shimia marina]SFD59201.1 hypothetical protein SAMN04488037_101612 [Shimia marina]